MVYLRNFVWVSIREGGEREVSGETVMLHWWGALQDNFILSIELIMKICLHKGLLKLTFCAGAQKCQIEKIYCKDLCLGKEFINTAGFYFVSIVLGEIGLEEIKKVIRRVVCYKNGTQDISMVLGPVHTKTIVNTNTSKCKLFYAFRPSVHTKTMKMLTINA